MNLLQALTVAALGAAMIAASGYLGRRLGRLLVWMNRPIWTRLGWKGDDTWIVRLWQALVLLLGAGRLLIGILQIAGVSMLLGEQLAP